MLIPHHFAVSTTRKILLSLIIRPIFLDPHCSLLFRGNFSQNRLTSSMCKREDSTKIKFWVILLTLAQMHTDTRTHTRVIAVLWWTSLIFLLHPEPVVMESWTLYLYAAVMASLYLMVLAAPLCQVENGSECDNKVGSAVPGTGSCSDFSCGFTFCRLG